MSEDTGRARAAGLEDEGAVLRGQPPSPVGDATRPFCLERHLSAILAAFPNLIFLIDPEDRLVECRAGRGAVPQVPPERFLGRRLHEVLPASVAARLDAELSDVRARGENAVVEYDLPADGAENHYLTHLVPLAEGYVASVIFDISHLRRTELALRRQEEQYRRIVETAQEGIWTLDADGRTTYVNARLAEILDCRPYDLLGVSLFDVVHPDDRIGAESYFERRRQGRTERRDLRLRRRDGRPVWVEMTTSPLRDGSGRLLGALAMVTDLTDRRRVEETLRASEARYRAIVESEPECVTVIDRDGRLLDINPAGLAMLEISSVADADDLLRFIAEEDRASFAALFRTVMGGGSGELQFRVVGARGTPRRLHTVAVPLRGADGSVETVLGISRDVTQSHQAEERLRQQAELLQTVFDRVPVALVVLDPERRVELVNQECERRLGWTAADLSGVDALAPLDAGESGGAIRSLFDSGDGTWRDIRTATRDGRLVEMRWAAVRLSDRRVIGIGQDVSEVRRLETRAWQAQKLESIGRLAGGVAHDFNNQLTAILGYAELLEPRLAGDPDARSDLNEISSAGRRARDLTAQLLAFGRRQVLAPRRLSLNQLVGDLIRLFSRLLGEHVRVQVDLAPDLWPIEADAAQLEQVLMNLALNARDAMPRGGELTITTRNLPGQGGGADAVQLTVRDSGQGMTEEVLEHLFEPFYTTKTRGQGTGLGLATVYGIVRQSGGQVAVTSAPGKGTAFEIVFPRAAGEVDPPSPPARSDDRGGQGRVLVVEDEPAVRMLTVRTLREAGYMVTAAATGQEALAQIDQLAEPVDLLVADVVMPDLSGRQVAEVLLRRFPRAECLYVSGFTSDVIGNQGVLDSGMNFLHKPYTPSALRAKVRDVLAARPGPTGEILGFPAASGS